MVADVVKYACRSPLALTLFAVLTCSAATVPSRELAAQERVSQSAPQIERPLSFDAAGRVLILTPTIANRWKLSGPEWPLGSDWKEARLYSVDSASVVTSAAMLVVSRVDGSVARYAYSADELTRLRAVINSAVLAMGSGSDDARGTTGFELSEPAGNTFVRNQTFLGLIAYGPATAAILSDNGAAAGGGYLLAAGSSFFVAARMVRNKSVSRAQALLAFHGGTRGAIAGAAVAAITDRSGGAGYGVPILAGALTGTVAGFRGARALSDGEAASSGFGADLAGLTTIGLSGAFGAFKDDTTRSGDDLQGRGKVALGGAIAAAAVGYVVGPRYARRSSYNVTAGDIDVGFTSAVLGALGANAFLSRSVPAETRFAVSTGGLLAGALIADRTKIRHADRTSADGTLVQLGAIAGALMGGGLGLIAEFESQAMVASFALGGVAGLAAADYLVRPSPDAGPKRGVLPSDGNSFASSRVSVSIVPAATTLAIGFRDAHRPRASLSARPRISNVPVVRIAF